MAFYRERDLKDYGKTFANDGVGIAGGMLVGGFVGRYAEDKLIKTPVTETSVLTEKLFAWAANNVPKVALYVLAKHYDAKSEMTSEAAKALMGSVVYDSILRLGNKGINPANVTIGGYRILDQNGQRIDVKKMAEENKVLRTELNKALQKLAGNGGKGLPPGITPKGLPGSERAVNPDRPGFGNELNADADARQKRYGAMETPASVDNLPLSPKEREERQRKYGAMPASVDRAKQFGFMSDPSDNRAAAAFGML